jgi:hypothetical protein
MELWLTWQAAKKDSQPEIDKLKSEASDIKNLFLSNYDQPDYHSVLMVNLTNVKRFSEYLHTIEREFLMVPGEPDEDYPNDEPEDQCLVNCWGSDKQGYVEQFRQAMESFKSPLHAEIDHLKADLSKANKAISVLTTQAEQHVQEIVQLKHQWVSVEDGGKPDNGRPVRGFHPNWIDEDFNIDGIRECFICGDGDQWVSAAWNDYADCYETTEEAPIAWLDSPESPSNWTAAI